MPQTAEENWNCYSHHRIRSIWFVFFGLFGKVSDKLETPYNRISKVWAKCRNADWKSMEYTAEEFIVRHVRRASTCEREQWRRLMGDHQLSLRLSGGVQENPSETSFGRTGKLKNTGRRSATRHSNHFLVRCYYYNSYCCNEIFIYFFRDTSAHASHIHHAVCLA